MLLQLATERIATADGSDTQVVAVANSALISLECPTWPAVGGDGKPAENRSGVGRAGKGNL